MSIGDIWEDDNGDEYKIVDKIKKNDGTIKITSQKVTQ